MNLIDVQSDLFSDIPSRWKYDKPSNENPFPIDFAEDAKIFADLPADREEFVFARYMCWRLICTMKRRKICFELIDEIFDSLIVAIDHLKNRFHVRVDQSIAFAKLAIRIWPEFQPINRI